MSNKIISNSELSNHNKPSDCWIAIDGIVYDVTKFANAHPGGKGVLHSVSGKDVTEEFFALHKKSILDKYGPKLLVGILEGNEDSVIAQSDPSNQVVFDTITPFSEPAFFCGDWKSPFYKDSHYRFRKAVREFLNDHIVPTAEQDDEAGNEPSDELFALMGQKGLLGARNGVLAKSYMKKLGINFIGGVSYDEFDYFHELVILQDGSRLGYPGLTDGLGVGLIISLPCLINFGTQVMKDNVVPELLLGKKRSCLAISEPTAGSDVANISCTAVDDDKGNFIVNGIKKWITNGYLADYFVTAVRTGGPGMKGISLLLIEKSEGLSTKKIKTSYSPAAGTAMVIYENVIVPCGNILGNVNEGFKCIMTNFNNERWGICSAIIAASRLVTAECYRWSLQRFAFGKRLMEQPVIRQKLAAMSACVESLEAWLEMITWQMTILPKSQADEQLVGPIALLKFQVSRNAVIIADNACQILGGRAITRTGMGQGVERFQRSFKFGSILGGSEEILADLAVRVVVGLALREGMGDPVRMAASRM